MVLGEIMVSVSDLSVDYVEFSRTRRNPLGKMRGIKALEGVTFSVDEGDIIALIGKNGAGKSTLLKAIAGQLRPSAGEISTSGRVILLSGVDPGFFHDATGRQNISELAGAYGIKTENIEEFGKSIIEFASLGPAIDRNVRGYSTGMRGKLGFGFMTALSPDLLLIDETLGVGDAEFRKKAQERLRGFIEGSRSVIISTHSLGLAKEICNRGLVLDSGKLQFDGEIEEALAKYRGIVGQSG